MNLHKKLMGLKRPHLILVIILAGFLVYLNSLPNYFVWDDEEQVLNNRTIQSLANIPEIFKGSTFGSGGARELGGMYYKPLMTLSYALNFSFWKLNPLGYHLFQLLVHLANAGLLFLLLNRLFELEKIKQRKFLSFLITLFFVVHPGNVEAAVYISSVQEVLYTFFGLFTLYRLTSSIKSKTLWKEYLVASALLLCSFLSKESAVTIIAIGLALTYLFLREKLKLWLIVSPITTVLYLFLRLGIAKVYIRTSEVIPIVKANFKERLLTIPFELFSYFRIFFFPKDLHIAQHTVIKNAGDFRFWLYGILVLSVTGILAYIAQQGWKRGAKLFAFFFLWYFSSIGPVLNIFPLDMTVAERWLYFPMIGLLGMCALVIKNFLEKYTRYKNFIPPILAAILILFGLRTIARNRDWQDGLTLYAHDINLSKDSFDLENNLGVEYFRVVDFERAKRHFERSIELEPNWWTNYSNLGAIYQRKGDTKKARQLFERAIENGNYYLAHENLAFLVLKEDPPDKAIATIKNSLEVLPYNTRLLLALTLAYYKGEYYEEAEQIARTLLRLEPSLRNRQLLDTIQRREPIEF